MVESITLFFLLICGHALADYPLQGDFLAKGKNHKAPIDGVPFYHCLAAHSLIHGGFVYLVTGSLFLGLLETICHAFIDFGKCDKLYGLNTDQALHVLCKGVWILLIILGAV